MAEYRTITVEAMLSNSILHSLTIDGTYLVEVYLLDPAGGVPIFA